MNNLVMDSEMRKMMAEIENQLAELQAQGDAAFDVDEDAEGGLDETSVDGLFALLGSL